MTQALRLRNQSQQLYNRGISQALRNGTQLYDPSIWLLRDADVEEKMLMDADIAHAVGFRRHLIAGRNWALTPRDDTSEFAELSVEVGTELLEAIPNFMDARLLLARAFFSGSRFSSIHHEPRTLTIGDGKPRTWWVITRLEDQDKRIFRIVPEHENRRAHWERWDVWDSEWRPETVAQQNETIRHVYEDDQAQLGHGRALREALGHVWYSKSHVFMESLQAVEKYGSGMIHAKIDGLRDAAAANTNTDLFQEWVDKLEDQRARHILVSDSKDTIEFVTGNGEGHQLLKDFRGELKTTIFTLVLGANLTTAADSGGSYALAEIQENSTEALIQFDRSQLADTLTRDLIGWCWKANHANLLELGIANDKPRFTITQEKRTDPKERAEVAVMMLQAGIPLATDEVLEQTGWSKPEEGEDITQGIQQVPASGDFAGLGLGDTEQPSMEAGQPLAEPQQEQEHQDTALNGAQVTAAAEIIDRVVNNTMPASTAVLMLTSMFNMRPAVAQKMVNDAAAFQLPPEPVPVVAPPKPQPAPAEGQLFP